MVCLLRGQTQSEIATELGLTTETVEHRLAALVDGSGYTARPIEHDDATVRDNPRHSAPETEFGLQPSNQLGRIAHVVVERQLLVECL